MSVIQGKAYWASIVNPNTTFDSDGVYSIDVSLDAKNKKIAETDGLTIKNKGDDRGDFVSIKRNVRRKNGDFNTKPTLMDSQKRNMKDTLIGNGSEVSVLYSTYQWEFKGRSGTNADLRAIQVTNLIPYQDDMEDAFDVVPDGFVAEEDSEVSFA
mgnify:FL=1